MYLEAEGFGDAAEKDVHDAGGMVLRLILPWLAARAAGCLICRFCAGRSGSGQGGKVLGREGGHPQQTGKFLRVDVGEHPSKQGDDLTLDPETKMDFQKRHI